MKTYIKPIVIVAFIFGVLPCVFATHRISTFQNKIHTLLHTKVIKELNLKGEKKNTVLKVMTSFDDKKVVVLDELMHLREDLEEKEHDKSVSESDLAELIEKIDAVKLKIQTLDQEKRAELKKVLTPEEVSKYLVVEHLMMDQIREQVKNELKKSPKTK